MNPQRLCSIPGMSFSQAQPHLNVHMCIKFEVDTMYSLLEIEANKHKESVGSESCSPNAYRL